MMIMMILPLMLISRDLVSGNGSGLRVAFSLFRNLKLAISYCSTGMYVLVVPVG